MASFPQHHHGGNHHNSDNYSDHDSDNNTQIKYTLSKSGRPYTLSHKIYFLRISSPDDDDGKHPKTIPISPFHDIPLFHSRSQQVYNMIVEIPRWSQTKFEISRSLPLNPIVQDVLSARPNQPRFVPNLFPYKGYPWNYGCLPQTWESPHYKGPGPDAEGAEGARGDNDPIDACEIGTRVAYTGEVKQVKVLGVLGLVDAGEMDWKVLVVDVRDKLAQKVDDIKDVERECPGLLEATRDWFTWYGVPEGRKKNRFALGGEWKGREYAVGVIKECEEMWKELVKGEVEGSEDVCLKNTTLDGTPGKVDPESVKLPPNEDLPPAEVEQDLEEVAYVDRKKGDEDEDEVGTEDKGTNYEEDSKTNDDEWDDLANDSALDDLKMLNVNLNSW
ncbi:inorganic pyrophosphatase [Neurospora crassa]|nr:inorganic pyrophosphatase [Neurospora crassa]CAB99389.1 related to INORGANIC PYROPHOSPHATASE [Neurospora crassa]